MQMSHMLEKEQILRTEVLLTKLQVSCNTDPSITTFYHRKRFSKTQLPRKKLSRCLGGTQKQRPHGTREGSTGIHTTRPGARHCTSLHPEGPYSIKVLRFPPKTPTPEAAASDSPALPPTHLSTLTVWTPRHPKAHGGNTPARKRKGGPAACTRVCSRLWCTCCPAPRPRWPRMASTMWEHFRRMAIPCAVCPTLNYPLPCHTVNSQEGKPRSASPEPILNTVGNNRKLQAAREAKTGRGAGSVSLKGSCC